MLKAIIFDMDGVLVISHDAIYESFKIILGRFGVNFDEIDLKKFAGMSLRDQLLVWKNDYPSIPKDFSYLDFARESTMQEFDLLKYELEPKESVLNLIHEAKRSGVKIAVATSSTRFRAELFLKANGVFEYLDAFVTSEDVSRHKPAPDLFLEAARRVGVLPENCVVIEDAVNGIDAANSAGMKSIAHLTKEYCKDDFYHADYLFDDFNNLKLNDLEDIFKISV